MIIVVIPKSPQVTGRIGSESEQDWYQSLVLAAEIARKSQGERPRFLIVTAFKACGSESEAAIYERVLRTLAPEVPREFIDEGYETVEQIERIRRYGLEHAEKMFIVSTRFHYPRVRWLARGIRATHVRSKKGLSRPSELWTDLALILGMPIIDMIGLRPAYPRYLKARREKGTF